MLFFFFVKKFLFWKYNKATKFYGFSGGVSFVMHMLALDTQVQASTTK